MDLRTLLPGLLRDSAEGLGLVVAATFVSDVMHWALHVFARSPHPLLRRIGGMHGAHHVFWDRDLVFHPKAKVANLLFHRLPEFVVQMLVVLCARWALDDDVAVGLATLFFVCSLATAVWTGGFDSNHRPTDRPRAPSAGVFVGLRYHAMHHLHPDSYFASFTTLFDRVFGTACHLRGRRVAMTGASGALGAPLAEMLRRAGVLEVRELKFGRDYTYDDYAGLDAKLRDVDLLVLCHGSKKDRAMQANCESYVALIERYRALRAGSVMPCEVWATGSEIECHPSWGNADLQIYLDSKRRYARRARWYFHQRDFVYRHIVPSAFTSRMGPGLISGKTAAAIALFFVRRGFRYVPVTYTGIALVNYLKFALRVHAQEPSFVRG